MRDLIANPAQREAFDQVTAVMSLMEGHADVMMDRVPPGAVPTLASIRAVFEQHRDQRGFSGLVSKLFGLNLNFGILLGIELLASGLALVLLAMHRRGQA